MIYTHAITSKGQITLPKEFRDKLGLDALHQAQISLNDKNEIVITQPKNLQQVRQLLAVGTGSDAPSEREQLIGSSLAKSMAFVDTNILLRYVLGDHPELTKRAEQLIDAAAPHTLYITDVVTAEIVYVLRATGRDRNQTVIALELLGRTPALAYENEDVTREVMSLLGSTTLDFADCYLIARALRSKTDLHTFDAAMLRTYKKLATNL